MTRRPWLLAAAVVASVLLFVTAFISPVASRTAAAVASVPGPDLSSRLLSYRSTTESLRATQRYELAIQRQPSGSGLHYLMGSSELSSVVDQNPLRWLPATTADFDLFLSGRGYVQSFAHAVELAAVAPLLQTKKVTLIISPQWFTAEGSSPSAFKDVFSASLWADMLDNRQLSPQLRQELIARGTALGAALPTNLQEQFDFRTLQLKHEVASANELRGFTAPYSQSAGSRPMAMTPWDEEYAQAEQQATAVSHNQFHIADSYYETYVKAKEAEMRGSMATSSYLQSPEYDDLGLFLDVAKELDVQVQLVSVPMNGWWYDHLGYSAEARASYYAKIRDLAAARSVRLADFSDREYQPAFLYDIMHLGWRGWLDVTRACYEFEESA